MKMAGKEFGALAQAQVINQVLALASVFSFFFLFNVSSLFQSNHDTKGLSRLLTRYFRCFQAYLKSTKWEDKQRIVDRTFMDCLYVVNEKS